MSNDELVEEWGRTRVSSNPTEYILVGDILAAFIRELENEIRRDAMQYLADIQRLEETIEDLTRRHKHALHKIDVLEDIIAEKKEKIDE